MTNFMPAILLLCTSVDAVWGQDDRPPIRIDGTGKMGNISEALIMGAQESNYTIEIADQESGSSGGFVKFAAGATDVSKAAIPMKPSFRQRCADNGVRYVSIEIGHDSKSDETLTFYVNKHSIQRDDVRAFITFCLSNTGQALVGISGRSLDEAELQNSRRLWNNALKKKTADDHEQTKSDSVPTT